VAQHAAVFGAEAQTRGYGAVDGHEAEPDEQRPGDSQDGILRPRIRAQRRLAQHRDQRTHVHRRAPDPVPRHCAIAQHKIAAVDGRGDVVDNQGMVEAVADPGPEGGHAEEDATLGEGVELGVAVEEAGGDELVENAEGEGGKDGEEDVVEGESPGFVDDGAGEAVLEGVLREGLC